MLKHSKLSMAVAGALALAGASTANAGIGFKAGEWDIDFSGNVNGFATYNDCASIGLGRQVAGGLACGQQPGQKQSSTGIESGLLPSALVFSAKSRQMNMDVGVTIGVYPTLRTFGLGSSGLENNNNGALGNSSLNIRQNFLTFGDASWGNIKIGRDIGLFGSDAILSDMTLLGVGSAAAFLGGDTTLGRIGVGYIYTDWIPQITYTSPSFSGFQVAGGMFQTFNNGGSFTGFDLNAATMSASTTPAWQAKVSFEDKFNIVQGDPLGFKAWAGYMYNRPESGGGTFTANGAAIPAGLKVDGWAWEIGARANMWGFELVGYYYNAEGIGTTGIGSQAASFVCPTGVCANGVGASLEGRKSDGYYGQITYKFQDLKIGYSYGQSNLDLAGNEGITSVAGSFNAANPNLLSSNSSSVVGLYYSLTKSLNLVGEWIYTENKSQDGYKYNDNGFALGAILFF